MKKNLLSISLAALTASVVFTACSSDELETTPAAPKSNVINLTSSLSQTRAASELQTTALSTSVKVGAFGVSGSSTISNGNNNQYSVESTAALSSTSDMVWPSDASATVSIYAYAPYQSGWTYNAANSFTVSADQSSDANYLASDLLYAKAENKSQTTDAIALNFKHQLARINVKIEKGEGADVSLNGAVISIVGTKTATTLNPSTGALGAASGSTSDIKVATLTADETATVYGIIVPQDLTANSNFVKIKTSSKTLVAKLSANVTIESGKSYNYTATIGAGTSVVLTLGSVTLTGWETGTDLGSSETEEYVAEPIYYSPTSFVALTSGQNATYENGVYTWTASSNNLMTIAEFSAGELANYHTLEVTTSDMTEGANYRIGYVVDGGSYTNFTGSPYYSAGKKTIDLTALAASGVDLSKVTKIQFGGNSGSEASITILPINVVFIGDGDGESTSGGNDNSGSGNDNTGGSTSSDGKLYASFGTPGGNAGYDATTFTYSWTGSTNNLMNCFSFTNGELANYTTLNFTFTELSADASVRINVLYSDNSNNSKSYYSAGTKATAISELIDANHTAADVTAIRFGGNSGSGSTVVKVSEMYLE